MGEVHRFIAPAFTVDAAPSLDRNRILRDASELELGMAVDRYGRVPGQGVRHLDRLVVVALGMRFVTDGREAAPRRMFFYGGESDPLARCPDPQWFIVSKELGGRIVDMSLPFYESFAETLAGQEAVSPLGCKYAESRSVLVPVPVVSNMTVPPQPEAA
jgi:hypothetical protein